VSTLKEEVSLRLILTLWIHSKCSEQIFHILITNYYSYSRKLCMYTIQKAHITFYPIHLTIDVPASPGLLREASVSVIPRDIPL
jgi:hypothetical protein